MQKNNYYKDYFTIQTNIYDKNLKIPDDYCIKIDLEGLMRKFIPGTSKRITVHHVVFMIRIPNLSKINDRFRFSKYRLTDFDINFAFDSHSFGEEFNLQELRGTENPEGDGDQEASTNGALFFTYYLHKNPKYGWFLENLHCSK